MRDIVIFCSKAYAFARSNTSKVVKTLSALSVVLLLSTSCGSSSMESSELSSADRLDQTTLAQTVIHGPEALELYEADASAPQGEDCFYGCSSSQETLVAQTVIHGLQSDLLSAYE